MREFRDRVAVVTGAASGIGRALALALARRGAELALVDLNRSGLDAVVREVAGLGRKASAHVADVADRGRMRGAAGRGARRARSRVAAREQRGRRGRWQLRGAELRGPRLDRRHQLLGRGARLQVLPAAPSPRAERPHREPLEHVRAGRLPRPELLLRHQVRGARPQRVALGRAAGRRHRRDLRPPGRRPHEHRAHSRHLEAGLRAPTAERFDRLAMPPETAAERILRAVERDRQRVVICPEARATDWLKRLDPPPRSAAPAAPPSLRLAGRSASERTRPHGPGRRAARSCVPARRLSLALAPLRVACSGPEGLDHGHGRGRELPRGDARGGASTSARASVRRRARRRSRCGWTRTASTPSWSATRSTRRRCAPHFDPSELLDSARDGAVERVRGSS